LKNMRIRLIAGAALLLASHAEAQSQTAFNLMPMPTSVQPGVGDCQLISLFAFRSQVLGMKTLERGAVRFLAELSRQTGIFFKRKPVDSPSPTLLLHAVHAREKVQGLNDDESYQLVISASGASLTAPSSLGILHGLQTFVQLVETTANGFSVPAVTITDNPRFAWRGLLIDVGRHFIPLEALKRNLDGMAAVKMNVLHLHLYDNEGFRVESRHFPSCRKKGRTGCITRKMRFATSWPTLMIGASVSSLSSRCRATAAHCLLDIRTSQRAGPYKIEPGGADAVMDPTREETYKFIDKLIEEMARLFPDDYFSYWRR